MVIEPSTFEVFHHEIFLDSVLRAVFQCHEVFRDIAHPVVAHRDIAHPVTHHVAAPCEEHLQAVPQTFLLRFQLAIEILCVLNGDLLGLFQMGNVSTCVHLVRHRVAFLMVNACLCVLNGGRLISFLMENAILCVLNGDHRERCRVTFLKVIAILGDVDVWIRAFSSCYVCRAVSLVLALEQRCKLFMTRAWKNNLP